MKANPGHIADTPEDEALIRNEIGAFYKQKRLDLGLTQEQFADLGWVTRKFVILILVSFKCSLEFSIDNQCQNKSTEVN